MGVDGRNDGLHVTGMDRHKEKNRLCDETSFDVDMVNAVRCRAFAWMAAMTACG